MNQGRIFGYILLSFTGIYIFLFKLEIKILPSLYHYQLLKSEKKISNLVAPNCTKTLGHNYTICKLLPYTSTNCGSESRIKNKNGTLYKVPNVVHLIWFGNMTFEYYNYLAIRSIASVQNPREIVFYYSAELPLGPLWTRAISEINCIVLRKIEEPNMVLGVYVHDTMARTDLARIEILIENGGIYLDLDVILLKSMDPLRRYPITLGRSVPGNFNLGIVLTEPKNEFLIAFRNEYPTNFQNRYFRRFTTGFLRAFYYRNKFSVHIEETAINRPHHYIPEDGGNLATTTSRMDISHNYCLHLHPNSKPVRYAIETGQLSENIWVYNEWYLRKADWTYGAAARVALFGFEDLVFLDGDVVFDRQPTIKIKEFPPETNQTVIPNQQFNGINNTELKYSV